MTNWKDLDPDQKILELKRQYAVLNMQAEFTFNDQQELLRRAREVIKALNGQKFSPKEISDDVGISEFALLIECRKAGYEESPETKSLVPAKYVNHIYELSEVAKQERFISNLQKENADLLQENIKLKKLTVSVKSRLK